MLVDTTCDTEEDITKLPLPEVLPPTWLIVHTSTNSFRPTSALLVKSTGLFSTNTNTETIHKLGVVKKYNYTGHTFDKIKVTTNDQEEKELLADWNRTGTTRIGFEGRRGFTPEPEKLMAFQFSLSEPREAKCVQPWFDEVIDINDPDEIITIEKILSVRNMHAILNSLNNIPFNKNGGICFPINKPLIATALPWDQFKELPFIAISFNTGIVRNKQAMVDMRQVKKCLQFMYRQKKCPVYGTPRSYYRICDTIPRSEENLQRLAASLEDSSRPSYPKDLRTLDHSDIQDRADKPLQLRELKHWLASQYSYGSAIWEYYIIKCRRKGEIPSVENLYLDFQKFVHLLDSTHQVNANNSVTVPTETEVDTTIVTLCNIVQYSINEKWLLGITAVLQETGNDMSSTKFNSKNFPANLNEILLDFCEELELISRET